MDVEINEIKQEKEMEQSESIKLIELLYSLETRVTDNVTNKITPVVTQVTDAVRNSNNVLQKSLENSIQGLDNKFVPKLHLWVFYPLLVLLYMSCVYLFSMERKVVGRERNLEREVIRLIETLQNSNIMVDKESIYRIEEFEE